MLLTKDHFLKVFPEPQIPTDNDSDLASNWLLNHGHKKPSPRVKTALKNVLQSNSFPAMLHQYMEQMRHQILSLQITSTVQLERTRTYFLFPTQYLQLEDHEMALLERTLDSLLRLKVRRELLTQDEFLRSIGLDTEDFTKLEYEKSMLDQVSSFAGIWNQSFIEQIDDNEFSKRELSRLRTNEIFDIVNNYPHSICALKDLRQCILPAQRVTLVNSFTQECNKRLLHAGANTNDIILCYTYTIKSFLIVDPRGVLLDNASRPIRRYLKEREDTIPNIVEALLNPNPDNPLSKLSEELATVTVKTVDELTLTWYPDPIDALPDFKKQDIIESLISIFDTKEVFVTEFASVFAKSLLSLKSYDISEVLTKLKLLKTKFGEGEFNSLDVMVRDIADSKISNYKIHDANKNITKALQFSILSYMYWPELPEEGFKLPEVIEQQVELYREEFSDLKSGRKMTWINAGVVTIQLELKDRNIDIDVSPAQAAVIYAFDNVVSLTSPQLSEMLKMDPDLVEDCLDFWISNGVLKAVNGSYVVLEEEEQSSHISRSYGGIQQSNKKQVERFEAYWPFIVGMLTNLGPLASSKIHSFLSMTLPKETSYKATLSELEHYLEKCVENNTLEHEAGKYKLVV